MKTNIAIGFVVLSVASMVGAETLDVKLTYDPKDVLYTPKAGYEQVELPGCERPLDRVGAPWLPAQFIYIRLPQGAENVSIRAEAVETVLRKGVVVYPAQPRVPRSQAPAAFCSAAPSLYALQAPWPARRAELTGVYTLRGIPMAAVRINPLRYKSAIRELRMATEVKVVVDYDVVAGVARPVPETFEKIVDSMVINPGSFALPGVEQASVDYVIVTSEELSGAFSALADYRASSLRTMVVTVESLTASQPGRDTPEKIRNGICELMRTRGISHVVLGGDDTVVPVRYCLARCQSETEPQMPADLYYSCLDGTWDADENGVFGEVSDQVDLAFDVVVGRIPVRTAKEASAYIRKLMDAEAHKTSFEKRMLIGGLEAWHAYRGDQCPSDPIGVYDGYAEFNDPERGYVSDSEIWTRRLYCDGIQPYWKADTLAIFCDTLTSWDGEQRAGCYAQDNDTFRRRLDEKWYHVFFSGHADAYQWTLKSGGYTVDDAAAMTGAVAIVYTDACFAGRFDQEKDSWGMLCEPSLSEAFLRNAAGGSLFFIGCSRYGWGLPDAPPASGHSDGGPSTAYGYQFYRRLHETSGRSVGLAFAMHKADMMAQCGVDGAERWIQLGLNLQGDPAGF